jgi:hypothetical protein
MTQRNVKALSSEVLWTDWRQDFERIKNDVYELFSSRRTFRDLADVFRNNTRLQDVGGYLWDWLRVSYASYVVMRIRRETDDQGNTVNLNQLLREIEQRPEVITRSRFFAVLNLPAGSFLVRENEEYFTSEWTAGNSRLDPHNPASDFVDRNRVASDREALQEAVSGVQEVANKQVAHRTRVEVEALRIPEVDQAFDAIEATLKKYNTLFLGSSLVQAEPVPQFNTKEVFTFPWIDPETKR